VVSRLPPPTERPCQTRFRFGSGAEPRNLADDGKSPDHYAKGTPSGIPGCPGIALRPLVGVWFQVHYPPLVGVPDSQPCSPRACNRTEHCVPERRALPLVRSTNAGFRGLRFNAFQHAAASFSVTGPFARNGLSLARNGFRFRGFHSGVNGPGLLLRSHANRLFRPFGLSAPPPVSVSPDSGSFLASDPLRFPRLTHLATLPASTPLRDFYFPLDQSVQRASPPFGPPSDSARSPLAPRCPIYY